MGMHETATTLQRALALARWLLSIAGVMVVVISLAGAITGLVLAVTKDSRLWSVFALSIVFGLGSLYILKLANDGLTLGTMLMGLCSSEEQRREALDHWSVERKAQLHSSIPPLAQQVFSFGRTDGATFEQMIRQYLEDFILSKVREILFYPLVLFAICAIVFFAQGGAMGSGSTTFTVLMVLGSLSTVFLFGGLLFGCCVYAFMRARLDMVFRSLHAGGPFSSKPAASTATTHPAAVAAMDSNSTDDSPTETTTYQDEDGKLKSVAVVNPATGLPVARPVPAY